MSPELITVANARGMMSVGRTKLYELINDGHLRTVKIGRRRLVRVDSIKALIEASAAA